MQPIAIILLNDRGLETAERLKAALSRAEIYGLAGRVSSCDKPFSKTAETLQQLAGEGVSIVGLCAAGILIRALAPILSDKRAEPPVVALADDGSVAVPLLGGLTGANELARQIADLLDGTAAITASGSRRFGVQLEAPPEGYVLANPEDAKKVTSDILAGASVRLEGHQNDWLGDSTLPVSSEGTVVIRTSPYTEERHSQDLLFRKRNVVVAFEDPFDMSAEDVFDFISDSPVADSSVACFLFREGTHPPQEILDLASQLDATIRYVDDPLGFAALNIGSIVGARSHRISLGLLGDLSDVATLGRAHGLVSVVGLGPGDPGYMSQDVKDALFEADDLVGYDTYLNLVPLQRASQQRHSSGNRVEIDRAQHALDLAASGRKVAVVSSGDPGIFAMASAVLEAYEASPEKWAGIDIEVLPGISAMQTAAAKLGAPLGHDFCAISLSDIRKPWDIIEKRLIAAAEGDFVIALYNPASKDRRAQIRDAIDILLTCRNGDTPVLLGQNLGREGERTHITTLDDLDTDLIHMRTLVIIGSSQTKVFSSPSGRIFSYSPRTYG